MTVPMTPPIASAAQDPSTRYEHYKTSAKERLKQQRACSELISDIAQDMWQAIQTGEWVKDLSPDEKKKPTREKWARRVLGITARQARKYFTVAENLLRAQVAGTGLCLDRMYQVALGLLVQRALLICLGVEGLTHAALSAGRRAGMELLSTEEAEEVLSGPDPEAHPLVSEALEVTERVARKYDRKEERQDCPKPKETGGDEGSSEDQMDRACRLLGKALEALSALEDLPADRLKPELVTKLVEQKHEVDELVDALADRIAPTSTEGACGAAAQDPGPATPPERPEEGPPERKETSAPAGEKRKETSAPAGKGTDFRPAFEAARALPFQDQNMLEVSLYQVAAGHAMKGVMPHLIRLADDLVVKGAPRGLLDTWLVVLSDPEHERRRAFAVWFHKGSRLPSFYSFLNLLRNDDLPPRLRQQVEALWAGPSPGTGCTPQRPAGEPANVPS